MNILWFIVIVIIVFYRFNLLWLSKQIPSWNYSSIHAVLFGTGSTCIRIGDFSDLHEHVTRRPGRRQSTECAHWKYHKHWRLVVLNWHGNRFNNKYHSKQETEYQPIIKKWHGKNFWIASLVEVVEWWRKCEKLLIAN